MRIVPELVLVLTGLSCLVADNVMCWLVNLYKPAQQTSTTFGPRLTELCCYLQASGAGDGVVRLWQVADGKVGKVLHELGGLPARGFVNALQFARSGIFLVAGMGQEPRLGRWARDGTAKNGLLIHQLHLCDD